MSICKVLRCSPTREVFRFRRQAGMPSCYHQNPRSKHPHTSNSEQTRLLAAHCLESSSNWPECNLSARSIWLGVSKCQSRYTNRWDWTQHRQRGQWSQFWFFWSFCASKYPRSARCHLDCHWRWLFGREIDLRTRYPRCGPCKCSLQRAFSNPRAWHLCHLTLKQAHSVLPTTIFQSKVWYIELNAHWVLKFAYSNLYPTARSCRPKSLPAQNQNSDSVQKSLLPPITT